MLDEFDRATSRSFRRSIAELIKNLSDRSARVQLVVAGVAANFMELIEHIPSIRRNVLNLELPRMDDSEVDEMLQIGSDESGLGFSDAARQRIRTIANGRSEEHTSELQSLMRHSYAVFCLKTTTIAQSQP